MNPRLSWPVVAALYGTIIGGLGVRYFGPWGIIPALIVAGLIGWSIERQRVADSKLPFSRDAFEDFGKELLKAGAEVEREECRKKSKVWKVFRALRAAAHTYFHPDRITK